jgi:hypothetical protein
VQKGEGFRLLGKCGVSVFRQAFYTELKEEWPGRLARITKKKTT